MFRYLPREVVFLLDEFGNITPIPEMAHILNVCLGRNIRFDMNDSSGVLADLPLVR
ncbi:MAG TPA: hypothetical protein DEP60_05600 [Ruminococcaceae bacterium]|nr:hypothetical protein [Oscillospiraceae bacterium]